MIVGAVVVVDYCYRYVVAVVVVVVVRTAGIKTVCCCLWPLHSVLERSHPRPEKERTISEVDKDFQRTKHGLSSK